MKSTNIDRVHNLYKILSSMKKMVLKICGFLSVQTFHFINQ